LAFARNERLFSMGQKTSPKMVKTGAELAGVGNGSPQRECNEIGTVFASARVIRELLQEALNNSMSVQGRLQHTTTADGGNAENEAPESLEDILTDCNYLARRLVSVSQELSGIIGE